jgi:hypothetical protein
MDESSSEARKNLSRRARLAQHGAGAFFIVYPYHTPWLTSPPLQTRLQYARASSRA